MGVGFEFEVEAAEGAEVDGAEEVGEEGGDEFVAGGGGGGGEAEGGVEVCGDEVGEDEAGGCWGWLVTDLDRK